MKKNIFLTWGLLRAAANFINELVSQDTSAKSRIYDVTF